MTRFTTTFFVLALMAFSVLSCGGGSGAPLPGGIGNDDEIGIAGKPAPGTANLSGALVASGGFRALSQAGGNGLPGAVITLINTLTGGIAGTKVTDNFGKFEFKGVPSGDNYLVKLEFYSTEDLDGDGSPDQIELYVPVSLADRALVELLQQVGVADSDGDGVLDAIELEFGLSDDSGRSESQRSQHRRRDGQTVVDDNNNGSFSDDRGFDDSNANGLPDAGSPSDSSSDSGWYELEVKGAIEALSATGITVGGVTFALTSATTWRIDDNRSASPSQFSVGMFVEVEGHPDGQGGWTATKVKTEDGFSSGGNSGGGSDDSPSGSERELKGVIEAIDATSITVGGVTFGLTSATTWRIRDDRSASPSQFPVGTFVEVEGYSDGQGGWVAKKVKTEDDFSSGGGSDDSIGGGSDDSPSGMEREVKGVIEAISASSITVNGVTFKLLASTTWRIDDNKNADPALFSTGMFVEVEGYSDGQGGWIAKKVKTDD